MAKKKKSNLSDAQYQKMYGRPKDTSSKAGTNTKSQSSVSNKKTSKPISSGFTVGYRSPKANANNTSRSTSTSRNVTSQDRINQKSYGATRRGVAPTATSRQRTTPATSAEMRRQNAAANNNLKQTQAERSRTEQKQRFNTAKEMMSARRQTNEQAKAQNAKEWEGVKNTSKEEQQAWFTKKAQEAQQRHTGKVEKGTDNLATSAAKSAFHGAKGAVHSLYGALTRASIQDEYDTQRDKALAALRGESNLDQVEKEARKKAQDRKELKLKGIRAKTLLEQQKVEELKEQEAAKDKGLIPLRKMAVGAASFTGQRVVDTALLGPYSLASMGARVLEDERNAGQEKNERLKKRLAESGQFTQEELDDEFKRIDRRSVANAYASSGIEILSELMFGGIGLSKKYMPEGTRGILDKTVGKLFGNIGKTAAGRLGLGIAEETAEEWIANPVQARVSNMLTGNRLQSLQEESVRREYQKQAMDLKEMQATSADINSDAFLERAKEIYKESGATDKEASMIAELARDYFNADIIGDSDTAEAKLSEITNILAGGENDLREKWTLKDALEVAGEMILSVGAEGFAGAISSSAAGNEYKANYGIEGVRKLAKVVENLDADKSDRAKAIIDDIDSGKDITGTQVSQIMEWSNETALKAQDREITRDNLVQNRMKDEKLFVPIVDSEYNLSPATDARFEEISDRVADNIDNMGIKMSDVDAYAIADVVAAYETGTISAEQMNELNVENPEARAVFERETGINLDQYTVKDKRGNIKVAESNIKMQKALFSNAADNYMASARIEQENWNNVERGRAAESLTSDMDGMGGVGIQRVLESVDPRNRGDFMLAGSVARRVYDHARLTNDSWEDVRKDFKNAFPGASMDESMRYVYDMAKRTKAIAETQYYGKQVSNKQSLADSETMYVPGNFTNNSERMLGNTELSTLTNMATTLGVNIVMSDNMANKNANGSYDSSTRTITLNAEKSMGEMLQFVLAHEVTHHLAAYAPDEYLKLSRFVMDKAYKADADKFEAAIKNIQKKYKDQAKQDLTPEQALEEIIADNAHEFWQDEAFINDVTSEEPTLAQSIINAIKDILNKLRSVLASGNITDENDRQFLFDEIDSYDQTYKLWMNAFRVARDSQANQAINDWQDEVNSNLSLADYEANERFSIVEDKNLIKQLEADEHITTYRGMVKIGDMYCSPMSSKVRTESGRYVLREGIKPGQWVEAEITTDPKMFDKDGKYRLMKDNGKVVPASYNPYMHSSDSMMNDQFLTQFKRPNLVVIEGVIPASEINNGVRREHDLDDGRHVVAKDPTGIADWKPGPVEQLLPEDRQRTVYLSDHFKMVREVPAEEVAKHIHDKLEGTGVALTYNSVTPSVRAELQKLGTSMVQNEEDRYKVDLNERYSLSDSNLTVKGNTARWTDSRIDSLIRENGASDERYSKAWAAMMSPRDFLKLTIDDGTLEKWMQDENETMPLDEEKLRGEGQTPFLIIDDTETVDPATDFSHRVTGHEGRHRMIALMNAGVESVPVAIRGTEATKYKKTSIPELTLAAQDYFGEGGVNDEARVNASDLVPIKESNRDDLIEKFGGDADVRFSISEQQDADYMKAVESGDMETAQRMVDEAANAAGYDTSKKLYHGTDAEFNVFEAGNGQYGNGVYLTYDEKMAKEYGKNILSFYTVPLKTAHWDELGDTLGIEDLQAYWEDVESRPEEFPENDATNLEYHPESINALIEAGYDSFVDEGNDGIVIFPTEVGGIDSMVKSADPVTYDDDGNVIPLSQRFDMENPDIRYSLGTESDIMNTLEDNFNEYKEDKTNLRIATEALADLRGVSVTGENLSGQRWSLGETASQGGVDNRADSGISSARTIAKGITSSLVNEGYIDFIGQKVESPEDLAKLGQVLRDPRFETFRLVLTKGNKIVSFQSCSARMPGLSPVHNEENDGIFYDKIKEQMKKLGADGYYLMHNHPSGDVTASEDDRRVTANAIFKLGSEAFKGHVILDHDKFGLISNVDALSAPGSVSLTNMEAPIYGQQTIDLIHEPEIDHPLLGEKAKNGEIVASIGEKVNTSNDYSVVIYVSSKLEVRGIQEVSNKEIEKDLGKFKSFIREQGVEFGSISALLYSPSGSDVSFSTIESLFVDGIILDAVYGDTHFFDLGLARNGDPSTMGRSKGEINSRITVYESAAGVQDYNSIRYSITPKMDADYMNAVNSNNMEEAQRLVNEAAKMAGYNEYVFHGTGGEFTEFDESKSGANHGNWSKYGKGFYFSDSEDTANYWGNNRKMIKAYIKLKNPYLIIGLEMTSEGPLFEAFNKLRRRQRLTTREEELDDYMISYLNEKYGKDYTTNLLKEHGYDGIIVEHPEAEGRYSAAPWSGTIEYIVFDAENIKSADPVTYADDGSVIPLSERFNPESNDIRYSLPTQDADGKILSDGQMDYFKNSQARDEQGRLIRLYHGTQNGGFTIFDPSYGISSRYFFFTDNLEAARGYSGTNEMFNEHMTGEEDTPLNYEVYLDMVNPLIVDAEGHSWVDIPYEDDFVTTNWLAEFAEAEGYDGVIIKNVIDRGSADAEMIPQNDYIVFNSNQIKDVNNLNPTENPDIRYSITPEDEVKSKMAYEYAMDDSYEALEYYEQSISDLTDEAAENRPIKKFSEDKISEFYAGLRGAESWVHTDPIEEEDAVRMAQSKNDFFANLNAKWNDRWTTEGEVLNVKSVKKDVRNLVMGVMQNSDTNSKYKNDLVKKTLFDVRTAFQLMKQDRPEVASELLYYSAQRMIDNVEFYVDGTFDQYKDLKHYLRNTRISLGEEYWADVEYDTFRKRNVGRIKLVKGSTNVDQVYQELEEMFPEFFDSEETMDVPSQLLQIEHVLDTVQPYKEAYSSEAAAELAFDIADDLYEIMVNGDEVRSLADTYKQRYDEKTKAMKQRHAEAMLRVRRARDEGIQAERSKFREYKERQKATRDHRKHYQRIQKNYDWLVQRILDPTKDKNVPEDFRQSLAEMLQTLDMQTENSKKLEAKTGHVAYKTFKMRELKDRLNEMAIKKGDNGVTIFELDANVGFLMDSLVEKLDGQSVDALDATTISEIDTVLAAIRGAMVRHNKIRIENKSQEISEIAGEITEDFLKQVEKRGKAKKYEGIRGGINAINTSELTPVYFFERLGKFNVMYNEVRYGGFDTYVRNEKHIIERMEEITKPYFNKGKIRKRRPKPGSELDKWRDSRSAQTFNLTNGSITLTTAQMMSLYCLSKREQAMKHMYSENGGIVATPIDAGTKQQKIKDRLKGKVETNEKLIVNEADVQTIIAALTPEQINVADQLQQLMANDMADLGNEAHREMYGYNVFEEQDYFPIKVHGNEIATDINDIGDVIQKIKSFGPAKPLDPHADNLIEIDDIFSVTVEHCNGMNLYNAFLVPISDFMRVYNYKQRFDDGKEAITVKDALEAAHGKKALDYIVNFMKDINGIKPDNRGGLEGVLNKALGTAKKTAVFGNIRVALQQPTAIVRALAEIKGKHLMPFIKLRPEKGVMEEMWKYCPIAYWKSLGYYDAYMGRDLEDTVMNNWSIADAALSDIYGSLDNWTWSLIWRAVKSEQAEAHPEMDKNSEEFLQMCGRRASEVFDKTQVVDSTFHRSDAMRSNQIAIKSLTAFMSEPTLTLNVFRAGWQKAIDQWQDGDKVKAAATFNKTVSVIVMQAALVSLAQAMADAWRGKDPGDLFGGGDDDDKDKDSTYLERLMHNLVYNFFDSLHLENNVYIVKDAMPLFNFMMSKAGDYYGWNKTFRAIMGWDQEYLYSNGNLIYAGGENVVQGIAQIFKKLEKGDDYDKDWYDIIQKTASGVGTFVGVPAGTLMRDFKPILDKVFENAFAADGSDVNETEYTETVTDKVMKKLGYKRKDRDEKRREKAQKEYEKERKQIQESVMDLEGEEKAKKTWSKVTTYIKEAEGRSIKELIAEGEFSTIDKYRTMFEAAGNDSTYFDERILAETKKAFKKTISYEMSDDEMYAQQEQKAYLRMNGMTDAEISEIAYKSDIAKDVKVAMMLGNEELVMEAVMPLVQAGITQEDFDKLWTNRNRIDLKKYNGRYKDQLKSTGTYTWPCQGTVTSEFGRRSAPTAGASSYHQAIDIGAAAGTPVGAADGGVVVFAGWNGAAGKTVKVQHDDGTITQYSHLQWWNVKEGDAVGQGQEIGLVGSTGVSTGPHLHFGVMRNGKYVDPMDYLS